MISHKRLFLTYKVYSFCFILYICARIPCFDDCRTKKVYMNHDTQSEIKMWCDRYTQ